MILGFKTQINGNPTHFVQKILACKLEEYKKDFIPKIHSIRKGKRWKAGNVIHMATGVRTKKYFRFNGDGIGLDVCKAVQTIEIKEIAITDSNYCYVTEDHKIFTVTVDGWKFTRDGIKILAFNDGFESAEDFFKWFDKDFEGQIIHWTDFKY